MKSALITFLLTQPVSDFDRQLVLATAHVESLHQPQVRGDGGRSWGLFQFGMARWVESGGARGEWSRAGYRTQAQVMLRALDNYKKQMPTGLSRRQQVVWLTNHHNAGRGSLELTPHVAKVLRTFLQVTEFKPVEKRTSPPGKRAQSTPRPKPSRLTVVSR